jgi:hypothetical protein
MEHADQPCHGLTAQSTVQRGAAQGLDSVCTPVSPAPFGHCSPPWLLYWSTVRVRVRAPAAPSAASRQVCEQAPHADHADMTQSAGQEEEPHGKDCDMYEHEMPPYMGARVTVRVRVCVPPPHVREHCPMGPQADSLQPSGHGLVLHCVSSVSTGQLTPPLGATCNTARYRRWYPSPHERVHAVHVVQLPTVQWSSHGRHAPQPASCVPTPELWLKPASGQERPPLAGWTAVARVRAIVPAPQVVVHADQAPHAPMTQSAGHGSVLQYAVSCVSGHATPPASTSRSTSRLRQRWPYNVSPTEHERVHSLQRVKADTSQSTGQDST